MNYESWFDRKENKTLLAICARKLIRNIGIAGVIFGLINIGLGIVALQFALINVVVLLLGGLMFAVGVQALSNPTLNVLLAETAVTFLLFFWNLAVTILDYLAIGELDPRSAAFSLIAAVVFLHYYLKIRHIREQIASVQPDEIGAIKKACKLLLKKRLKDEPTVIQTRNRKCRAELMEDRAFFIQRNLMRAFIVPREDFPPLLKKADAKALTVTIRHPVQKLRYAFDRKNSAKLKAWLTASDRAPAKDGETQGEPLKASPASRT